MKEKAETAQLKWASCQCAEAGSPQGEVGKHFGAGPCCRRTLVARVLRCSDVSSSASASRAARSSLFWSLRLPTRWVVSGERYSWLMPLRGQEGVLRHVLVGGLGQTFCLVVVAVMGKCQETTCRLYAPQATAQSNGAVV